MEVYVLHPVVGLLSLTVPAKQYTHWQEIEDGEKEVWQTGIARAGVGC